MKPECNNCRWKNKRYPGVYPCCDCIGLNTLASYNFFPISLICLELPSFAIVGAVGGVCIWNLAIVVISIFTANVEIPCRQK